MRKRISAVAAVVLLAVVGSAVAAAPSPKLAKKYLHLYAKVVHVQGKRAPGRNIIRWGFAPGKPATAAQVRKSMEVLHRMLLPLRPTTAFPAAPSRNAAYHTTQVQQSAPAPAGSRSSGGGGGGGLPACASESGTDYSTGSANTNASSGATGRYQILPSTHDEVCPGLGWSPSDQDQCAARIYRAQGSGAWVGCGG